MANAPNNTLFSKDVLRAAQNIPASSQVLSDKDSVLYHLVVSNPTAGSLVVSVFDNPNGTPKNIIQQAVASNSTFVVNLPKGAFFNKGIGWQASGAGLVGSVFAQTRPDATTLNS
jgi:hypothetical protein